MIATESEDVFRREVIDRHRLPCLPPGGRLVEPEDVFRREIDQHDR
ncbi:hypothetical protein [Spongiactinospora sp. 9N601]